MGIGAGLAAVGTALGTAVSSIGTAGAIGLASTAVGAGVSAYSAISSGQAQKQQADYQSQVARNNATISSQNAASASRAGQAQATAQSMKNRSALGALTAGEAANGLDIDSGSAAQSIATQREEGQLDTMTTAHNAALQAYSYNTQSTNYSAQSGLDTASGANEATAGDISAGGGLLNSVSSIGLNWQRMQQQTANTNSYGGTSTGQAVAGSNGMLGGGV